MTASRSGTQQQQQPAAQRTTRDRSPASRPDSIRQSHQTNRRTQHQPTQLKGQKGSSRPQQVCQHWRVRSRWRKAGGPRWCGALSAEIDLTSHRTNESSHHPIRAPELPDSKARSTQGHHRSDEPRKRSAREEYRACQPTPPPINARAAMLLSPSRQRSIQKPQIGLAVTLVGDHSTKEPATTDSHRAR